MSSTSNPKVSLAILAAQLVASIKGRTDLICGTIPSSATAVAGQLYNEVESLTKTELDTLFGIDTDIRNRIQQFQNSNSGYSNLSVKAVAESSAPAATVALGKIAFGTDATGIATEDGTYIVSAVDNYQWSVKVSVITGDSNEDVVDAIAALFSNYSSFPMIAAKGANIWEAEFTSVDKGTIGNNYKLEITGAVAGIGAIIVTQPVGGANDAVVDTFFDALQSSRFTGINWPTAWLDQVSVVKDYLDDRFNSNNAILDGVAFAGYLGTFANAKAQVASENSRSLVIGGARQFTDASGVAMFQPADWSWSYFQGVRARRLTDGAGISQFIVTTAGTEDVFGGPALASLPYFNTPLAQLGITDPNDMYSNTEQEELEDAGFAVYGVNDASNGMIMGPVVTTSTTDSAGNPNDSFKYLNYVDTSSVCREYMHTNLKSRFSQSRITPGALVNGKSVENEASIRSEFGKLYKKLSLLALTVKGPEAEKFFLKNLNVALDFVNRKSTVTMQLPILTQLGTIIGTVQLNFDFKKGV